jgi:hypothetical protein
MLRARGAAMRRHVLWGVGLMLVSLCGGISLPTAWAASGDTPTFREYQGFPEYRDYRGYRLHRGPEGDTPDRFAIHKGRKCQIRCERIPGTHDYRCHEYRC